MSLTLVTPPDVEPVTLEEAKKQLEIPDTFLDDDDFLPGLITAARMEVEAEANRKLISQVWELKLDAFPGCDVLEIPASPLQTVTWIQYLDGAGVEQTLATSVYVVDAPEGASPLPGRIWLAYGQSWPVTRATRNAVRIRFVAGYGDDASFVPGLAKHAIKMALVDMHQHRDPALVRRSMDGLLLECEQPTAATRAAIQRLIWPIKLPVIA